MVKNNQKIPDGWSVKKLGEVTTLLTNGFVGSATPHYTEDETGVTYIQGFNVNINSFDLTGIKKVTLEFHKKNKKSCLQEGDLLTIQTGDIGVTARVPKYLAGSNCHALIISRFDTSICNSEFYLQYYNSSICQSRFKKIETGSTMKHLNVGDLESEYIPIPPLSEQEKIAGILETWDEAIEKLSDLIEQKKLLKKGLMQKLLTGKTRLPGFTQPWKEVKLGEIFNIKKGQGLSKDVLDSKGVYKCILYGELYTKYSEVIKNTISRTNKNEKITSNIGDILIPASTTTSGIDLANATALFESDVILGGDINILRAKKEISPVFFAYLLTHSYKFDIARLAQGITIVHLYAEFLKSMKVFVPIDINEQQAIADVLSAADEEIDLLNKKLEALKEQKKGLMQQLLTGQTRVKVN